MSLGIAVVVREGIILAADSRTTALDQANQLRIATDYTKKLFRCGKLGIITAGWNTFGERTIGQILDDFCASHKTEDVRLVAEALADHFLQLYSEVKTANPSFTMKAGATIVEFIIAGYSGTASTIYHAFVHEPTEDQTAGKIVREMLQSGVPGAAWVGSSDFVQRLTHGYSTNSNLSSEQIAALRNMPLSCLPNYGTFTLQDAVNYAVFMIEVTMKMQRFTFSRTAVAAESANVGGAIDVAGITPRGFDWIQQKSLEVLGQISADKAIAISSAISPISAKNARKTR
jgi:hypothetical protein